MTSLILLPGLDVTGLLFRPLVECLPEGIDPIVVAYPTQSPLGYEELLPLVRATLPSTPFVLLGESFSGPLAVTVAENRPQGLRGIILCASFFRSPMAFLPAWCSNLLHFLPLRLCPLAVRLRMLLGRSSDPALRRLVSRAIAAVPPEVVVHRIRSIHRVNVARQLSSCPVPVLYLRGDRDRVVPRSAMRFVLRINPNVQVATLPARHMVLQTQPAACAEVISAFLQSVGAV